MPDFVFIKKRRERIRELHEQCTQGFWEPVYMHGWALGVGVQEPPTHEYLTQVFKMIGNTLDHDTPDTVSNRKRVAATAECIAEDHNAIIQLLDALEAAERRIADLEKTCAMQGTRFS